MRICVILSLLFSIASCNFCTAQQKTEGLSIKRLSELTGNSGRSRDIWLDPKDDGTQKRKLNNQFSLDRNSQYRMMFTKSHFRQILQFSKEQINEMDAEASIATEQLVQLSEAYSSSSEVEKETLEEKATEIISSFDRMVEKIMLPHQTEALKQMLVRDYVTREGFFSVLIGNLFDEQLQLSNRQKEEIKEEANQLAVEFKSEINAMREKAVSRMLSYLNENQLEVLKATLGDDFEDHIEPHFQRMVGELYHLGKTAKNESRQETKANR